MELSPTARVILGMLGFEPMSGYEIKSFVDHSTRFFWAASYGQIYPELRKLADAGLIAGEERPHGARRRTVYELTAEGREALEGWLLEPPEIQETRDEGMLKMFFADAAMPAAVERTLEAKRDHHLRVGASLREIRERREWRGDESTLRTLRLGIAVQEFVVEWCEHELEGVRAADAGNRSAA